MRSILRFLKRKSVIFVIVVAAAVGGYFLYDNSTKAPSAPRYVTAAAEKQSLSVSVSGTGQVSSTSQVDVKPNASGTITSVNAVQGKTVAAGAVLATIDSRLAQRNVADAQTDLETAQLNLNKAKEPTDALTVLQQKNSLIDAQNSLENAKYNLGKAYDDGYAAVNSAITELSNVMTGLQNVLMGNQASTSQWNLNFYADSARKYSTSADAYRDDAYNSYIAARDSYDVTFAAYKKTDSSSDDQTVKAILAQTYASASKISAAVKNASDVIQFYKDQLTSHNLQPLAIADTNLNSLAGYASTVTSRLSSLLSAQRTIDTGTQTIDDTERSIEEKKAQIAETNAGPDELEIRSLELAIRQKQNALQDARDKLADYTVRAPFSGVVAAVNAKKGDTASSGTAVATLISPQLVADISLNEVDVAKIKVGQKATIAFDAIEDLSISGVVAEVDTVGSASQGVVSYGVQIAFDTDDNRIKSGMSVAAAIITDFKPDVLAVPNTAIKTQNGQTYVQIMKDGAPVRTAVTVGIANDTDTEITSGLSEGDEVVTQTITSASTSTTTGTRSGSTGIPGLTGGTTIRMNTTGGFR